MLVQCMRLLRRSRSHDLFLLLFMRRSIAPMGTPRIAAEADRVLVRSCAWYLSTEGGSVLLQCVHLLQRNTCRQCFVLFFTPRLMASVSTPRITAVADCAWVLESSRAWHPSTGGDGVRLRGARLLQRSRCRNSLASSCMFGVHFVHPGKIFFARAV